MQKFHNIMRWIFSAATVGIVLLLCWQCLDIYLVGNRPENMNAGVYITSVYNVQNVSERLAMITPAVAAYAVIAVLAIVSQLCDGKKTRSAGKAKFVEPRTISDKVLRIARITVLCLGVLFIVLGTMNGGARDVLVKAINICTECIGLG